MTSNQKKMTEREVAIQAVTARAAAIIRRQGGPHAVDAFQVRDAIEQGAEAEAKRVDHYEWTRFREAVRAQVEDRFGFRRGAFRVRD